MKNPIINRTLSIIVHLVISYLVLIMLFGDYVRLMRDEKILFGVILLPLAIIISLFGDKMVPPFTKTWIKLITAFVWGGMLAFSWIFLSFQLLLPGFSDYIYRIPGLVCVLSCSFQLVFLVWRLPKAEETTRRSKWLFLLFPILAFASVSVSYIVINLQEKVSEYYKRPTKEKLGVLLKADNLHITYIVYGGVAGYSENHYYLKMDKTDTLIMMKRAYEPPSELRIGKEKVSLLRQHIVNCFETHDPDMELIGSGMFSKAEVEFRSGMTVMSVKPTTSDALFEIVLRQNKK